MAVVVPSEFPLRRVQGAAQIYEGGHIRDTAAGLLLGAANGAYSGAAQGLALCWCQPQAPITTTITSPTARELVLRSRLDGQAGRNSLVVIIDGQSLDIEVTAELVGGGSQDSDSLTITTRELEVLTLTVDEEDVWIEVRIRAHSSSVGYLYGITALLSGVDAADLPTTWATDETAGDDGEPLDAALLQRLAAATRDAHTTRAVTARASWDERSAPRLCGLGRVVFPVIFPLSSGVTSLKFNITGICGQEPVRVGVILRREDDLVRPPTEELWAYEDLAVSGSRQTVALIVEPDTAGVSRLAGLAGSVVVALICVESQVGDEDLVTEVSGDPYGSGVVSGWDDRGWIELTLGATTSGAVGLSTGIPAQAARVALLRFKGGVVASGTEELDPEALLEWEGLGVDVLAQRQVERVNMNQGNAVAVYPRPERDYTARQRTNGGGWPTTCDDVWNVLYVAPLGYLELLGVEVLETARAALPGIGTRYNARQDPVALAARRLYQEARDVWALRPRVYACSPSVRGIDDPSAPAAAWWGEAGAGGAPSNPLTTSVDVELYPAGAPGDWDDASLVAHGLTLLQAAYEDGAESYVRTSYSAALLVRLQSAAPGTREALVRLRALTPADEADEVAADETAFQVEGVFPSSVSAALLHALSGVTPAAAWGGWGWQLLRLELLDEIEGPRRVSVQVQVCRALTTGQEAITREILEVGAWALWETTSTDPDEVGFVP